MAAALVSFSAAPAMAQGGLSVLGFGYPVGGASTRTAGTAGSFGEFDPLSPINPASLGGLARTVITAQTEPEFRTVKFGGASQRSSAQRVPLLNLLSPIGHGVAVGLSATTFLDRSFTTVTAGSVSIDGNSVSTVDQTESRGSIADLRAAAGWRINDRFSVGVGAHLFNGDNQVVVSRTFSDTLKFGNVNDTSQVVYFGTALSVGGEWRIRKGLATMLSYRKGNSMESRVRDTVRTRANVPDRVGFGVRFDGIPGSVFGLSVNHQNWSKMQSLGSSVIQPRDATDWSAGAEVEGPHVRGMPMLVRAGFAKNALPFGINSGVVSESRFSTGVGIPISREQAVIDLSLQRANRSLAGSSAKESAWMLGIGMQIRP